MLHMHKQSKAELKMKLRGWVKAANDKANKFLKHKDEWSLKARNYHAHILKSFMIICVRSLPLHEVQSAMDTFKHLNYNVDGIRKLPNYSLFNPLVILRIYQRKLWELESLFYKEKESLKKFYKELKEIDQAARKFREYAFEFESSITVYKGCIKELLSKECDESNIDYWSFIEALFSDGQTLKRDDFFQVITINKSFTSWHGTLVEPYKIILDTTPAEINFTSFKYLILTKCIEAQGDNYLRASWVKHYFKMKKKYQQKTGKKEINFLKILGESAQTLTATTDVPSKTFNRPNLRVIKLEDE